MKELRDSGERVRADERILGGNEFVERVLKEADEEWERMSLLRQKGVNLSRLMEKIADYFGVEIEDLKSGSKVAAVVKARAIVCYVGVRKLGLTAVSVARELEISPSEVSKSIRCGQQASASEAIEVYLIVS